MADSGNCLTCSDPRETRCNCVLRWLVFSFSILVWAFAVESIADCNFIIQWGDGYGYGYDGLWGFGLFSANHDWETCEAYDDYIEDYFDGFFKAGRAFGAINMAVVTITMLIAVVAQFVFRDKIIWWVLRVLFPVCMVTTSLIHLAWASDFVECGKDNRLKCAPGPAAGMSIVSFFFLLALSILVCFVKPRQRLLQNDAVGDTSPKQSLNIGEGVTSTNTNKIPEHSC